MKILVIPGIGDIHWVALKLQSFLASHGERIADVTVWNFDDRPRSLDFVSRIPFMRPAGYLNEPIGEDQKLFHKLYMTGELDAVKDFRGFDYLLCVNGSLRVGRSMDEILPEYRTNWNYKITETPEDHEFGERFRKDGRYVLLYFSEHGMFKRWVKHLPAEKINGLLEKIRLAWPDRRLVLTGSEWDLSFTRQLNPDIDLVGLTSLGQLLGLTRRADAFLGWCGGNTIVSAHLNTPTIMLWSDYFKDRRFQYGWVKPGTHTYIPLNVENLEACDVMRSLETYLGPAVR